MFWFEERPTDDIALVDASETVTYRELARRIDVATATLRSAGIGAGRVVSLSATHGAEGAALLLALARLRACCVPMTNLPAEKRDEFLATAQVETVVTAEPGAEPEVRHTGVQAEHPLYEKLRDTDHTGLVLFSSGTTGASKASVLDLDGILARYSRRGPTRTTLTFLNFDHVGGINTLLHTLAQGGTLVTVDDRGPENVFATIARHRVEVLPTSPTFLTMALVAGAHLRHDISSLRLITYGTEPMPGQTLRRLAAQLPDVELKQTYGLSELGIMSTRSRANDSLWVSLGGSAFDYKVVDGVLWIRSETAMLGYLNAPAPFDDEGYFNTQDAVEVDGDYVHILGRTSELINVGGEKVYPNEVESVLLEMENVADVTVRGIPNAVTGQIVAATLRLVEPEDRKELRRRVDAFCRDRLEPFKVPAKLVVTDAEQHSARFKKLRAAG